MRGSQRAATRRGVTSMPPPPPPGAPPPPKGGFAPPKAKKGGGGNDRGALLNSIQKGTKLKKTVTNDRSAPLVGNTPNAPAPGGGRPGGFHI